MQVELNFQKMSKGKLHYVLIFFIVGTVFFAIRSTQGLVWNDSPGLAENIYGFIEGTIETSFADPICRDEGAFGLRLGQPDLIKRLLTRAFSCVEFGGYRPLSAILSLTAVAIFSEASPSIYAASFLEILWRGGWAILFGIQAVLLFNIARRYVQTDWTAYAILVLFFCSPPVVGVAWVLFSGGLQITVTLVICLGLWIYWQLCEETHRRNYWMSALILVLLLGPWVREYIGLVACLVIFLELQTHRRVTGISLIGLVGFIHALFPTALLVPFFPQLPLELVFKLGNLNLQLDTAVSFTTVFSEAKWGVAKIFLVVVPPSLLVSSGLMLIWSLKRNAFSLAAITALAIMVLISITKPWFWLTLVAAFCLLTLFSSWRFQNNDTSRNLKSRLPINCQFNQIAFLNCWFILSFLPFLIIFASHVHLSYPLIPALILIAASTEHCWLRYLCGRESRMWKKALLAPILLIGLLDQAMNVYGSYATVDSLYGGIRYMADWMRGNTPKGTFVVTNALHAEDIRFYSQNHIIPFWSVNVGVPNERTLEQPKQLEEFLQRHFGENPILMLDITQDFSPAKGAYHAHKYINRQLVPMNSLGTILAVKRTIPFVDPLKNMLPKDLVLFLGPPDLENDVYFGRSKLPTPFFNEIHVSYKVYVVTGSEVSPMAYLLPDETFLFPTFLTNYRGYNLWGLNDKLLATPETWIPHRVMLNKPLSKRIIIGTSVKHLKSMVDQILHRTE